MRPDASHLQVALNYVLYIFAYVVFYGLFMSQGPDFKPDVAKIARNHKVQRTKHANCDRSATKFQVLEPVGDAIVPKTIKTLKRPVHRSELFYLNAANLFDRSNMALIQSLYLLGNLVALVGQAYTN